MASRSIFRPSRSMCSTRGCVPAGARRIRRIVGRNALLAVKLAGTSKAAGREAAAAATVAQADRRLGDQRSGRPRAPNRPSAASTAKPTSKK